MSARYKSEKGLGKRNTGTAAASRKVVRRVLKGAGESHWLAGLADDVGRACKRWLLARGIYYDTFSAQKAEYARRGVEKMNGGLAPTADDAG